MALNVKDLKKGLGGYFTVAEALSLEEGDTFTIISADMEEVGQGASADDKPVLGFSETKKKLVLNKGRLNQLDGLFGETPSLVGKVIALGVEKFNNREQIVINGVD